MSDNPNDTVSDEEETEDPVETHEKIKPLTSNWKLLSIVTAFLNRVIFTKADMNNNVTVVDRKPVLIETTGEPSILNVTNVDVYNINIFRQIHQTFDMDLQYLNPNQKPCEAQSEVHYIDTIPPKTQIILNHLLAGLVNLNEHLANFIAFGSECLYDQRIKKIIEYLLRQREYYLLVGTTKTKYSS
jgi:hypothetical protein